eukprot:5242534-Amphidinium_carterae.1
MKGKKDSMGKGKSPSYFEEQEWNPPSIEAWWSSHGEGEEQYYLPNELDYESAYATSKGKGKSKSKDKDVCHLCGQRGHWKNECPMRKPT